MKSSFYLVAWSTTGRSWYCRMFLVLTMISTVVFGEHDALELKEHYLIFYCFIVDKITIPVLPLSFRKKNENSAWERNHPRCRVRMFSLNYTSICASAMVPTNVRNEHRGHLVKISSLEVPPR